MPSIEPGQRESTTEVVAVQLLDEISIAYRNDWSSEEPDLGFQIKWNPETKYFFVKIHTGPGVKYLHNNKIPIGKIIDALMTLFEIEDPLVVAERCGKLFI